MIKLCKKCKSEKPTIEFYHYKDGRFYSWCKLCHSGNSNSNPNRKKIWRKSALKRQYGISNEIYAKLKQYQKNLCAICRQKGHTNIRQKYPLYVDHNHITGKVRGLLCAKCHTMLGYLEDSNLCKKGFNYLKRSK